MLSHISGLFWRRRRGRKEGEGKKKSETVEEEAQAKLINACVSKHSLLMTVVTVEGRKVSSVAWKMSNACAMVVEAIGRGERRKLVGGPNLLSSVWQ